MRKIDEAVMNAVMHGDNLSMGNTQVLTKGDFTSVRVHGNLIARIGPFGYWVLDTCGWNTDITIRRMNSVCQGAGISIMVRIRNGKTQFMHKGIVIKQGSRLDYDEAKRLYSNFITKKVR
jgi:hypothetical protein